MKNKTLLIKVSIVICVLSFIGLIAVGEMGLDDTYWVTIFGVSLMVSTIVAAVTLLYEGKEV